MLRDVVAPSLRGLGFKGSGSKFVFPSAVGDFAGLGFQKDWWNTPQVCRFTVNVAFISGTQWQQARDAGLLLPDGPNLADASTVGHHVKIWAPRIGKFLDPPHDH